MNSLDFYRHKTVIPTRGSWEKLLHWSLYSTANLEQFEERKLLRFLRILKLAKFMQGKTWMLDEWFSYMELDRKIMITSSPHCPFPSERYPRRTKFSLFGDQKSIRLTFNMLYLLDLWYSHLFRLTLNKVSRRDPHDVIAEMQAVSVCLLS